MFWDEWKPTFRLTKRYLVYGWAAKSVSVKTNKLKKSERREGAWKLNEQEEEATKQRESKKEEHTRRFILFLHREINIVYEFPCTRNVVCMHVT